MTVITINQEKTKEQIIEYLKEENLIPNNYKDITVTSDYFNEKENKEYSLQIKVIFDGDYEEEFNYIISNVSNEKVNIQNNSGYIYLSSIILLLIIIIYLLIRFTKNMIIKRKNKNKDSIEL